MLFPKFSNKRLEKLSDILSDVALVSLASVVLPAILDRFSPVLVVLGGIVTVVLWIFSLWLRK